MEKLNNKEIASYLEWSADKYASDYVLRLIRERDITQDYANLVADIYKEGFLKACKIMLE